MNNLSKSKTLLTIPGHGLTLTTEYGTGNDKP
jgi:hypothetical protein